MSIIFTVIITVTNMTCVHVQQSSVTYNYVMHT